MKLSVDHIAMRFGGNTVLRDIEFSITEPQICGLIGPNGAGKTTLTNIIDGVYSPTGGSVHFNDKRIDGLKPFQIARLGFGRTFQIPRPFERMTVTENLKVPAVAVDPRVSGDVLDSRISDALEFLTIDHLADELARALSGGQKKLLELARLLMLDPDLIVLDEPFAGVHPLLRETIHHFIRSLREQGKAFIIISHDMNTIFSITERLLVLAGGTVIADDSPELVRADPAVIEAYLGSDGAPADGGDDAEGP